MKAITILLILIFSLSLLGLFVVKTMASEFSPSDFILQNEKFEIKIGVDKENGRYYTYHYEFSD